jgi:hypothetical protein
MRTTTGGAVSAMGRGVGWLVRFLGATSRRPDSRAPGADRSQRDTMSNIWSKTVWIIMLAVIAGGAAAADPGGPAPGDPKLAGHFSGRVTGPNGQPLGGARVYITPIKSHVSQAGSVRAETGADGRFDFDAPDMTFIDLDGLPARRQPFSPGRPGEKGARTPGSLRCCPIAASGKHQVDRRRSWSAFAFPPSLDRFHD